jgi:hypothetical protein
MKPPDGVHTYIHQYMIYNYGIRLSINYLVYGKEVIMKMLKVIFITGLILGLSGCASMGPNETAGTLIGGAAGGLLGSTIGGGTGQVAAAAGGAILGSMVGGQLGRQQDANQGYYQQQQYYPQQGYYGY